MMLLKPAPQLADVLTRLHGREAEIRAQANELLRAYAEVALLRETIAAVNRTLTEQRELNIELLASAVRAQRQLYQLRAEAA